MYLTIDWKQPKVIIWKQDKDKDGIIKDSEFLKVIESLYEFKGKSKKDYPPSKCVADIFRRIDENGDRRLTKEEFIVGCLENKNIMVCFKRLLFLLLLLFLSHQWFSFPISESKFHICSLVLDRN